MSYFECFSITVPKNDVSTFFLLNIAWVFARNWVLRYINVNAKRSAESILMLYIHFPLSFPDTSGASYTNCYRTINIHSPNVACVAGAWKYLGERKNGRARVRHAREEGRLPVYKRSRVFFDRQFSRPSRTLIPSGAC